MKKILIILIIAAFAINLFDIRVSHDWGDDFSGYINQAKAVVGHDTNHLKEISDERVVLSEFQVGPSLYPWGYPLILAIAMLFFGMNLAVFKIFTYFFFIGSAVVFYYLIRDYLPKNLALLLVLVFSLSPFFTSFKQQVLSDVPAMFFLLLSLLFIQIIYSEKKGKTKNAYFVALGASMFLSYFVRTSSIVILPILFFVQLVNWRKCFKDRKSIIESAVPYATFLILHFASKVIFPSSSYSENITLLPPDFWSTVSSNVQYYSTLLIGFFGDPKSALAQAVYFMSVPFLLFGIISGFKKNYIFIIYGTLTMGLYLLFPHTQGLRFIMSLIPIYLYFVFIGFRALDFEKFKSLNFEKFALSAGILLAIFFARQDYPRWTGPWLPDGPYAKTSTEMFDYVKKNTKETDMVAFFKPRALYLMTGRSSIWIVTPKTLESNTSTDYFIYTNVYDDIALKDYLGQNKKLIFENEKFWMYKMK